MEKDNYLQEKEKIDREIRRLLPGLEYEAAFIPASKIGTIMDENLDGWKMYFWNCILKYNNNRISLVYYYSVDFIPYYDAEFARTMQGIDYYRWITESGRYLDKNSYKNFNRKDLPNKEITKALSPPRLSTVFETIVVRYGILQLNYEDHHSEQFKKNYMQALQFRKVFGDDVIYSLKRVFCGDTT